MCNLYRMTRSVAEIANLFRGVGDAGANLASEAYPGYSGLVVAEGRLRTMAWGFPLVLKGKQGQPLKPKPVNNARSDKLDAAFWRDSFTRRRCLIPVSAWAEAEGPKGAMTRTWLSMPDGEPFAVAGLWRPTAEWGDAYAMAMVGAAASISQVHDRMPVVLGPDDWETWTQGSPEEAMSLCRPWHGEIAIERTDVPWFARR